MDLGDPSLSAMAKVALAYRNPNDRVSILYRRLDVFVIYRKVSPSELKMPSQSRFMVRSPARPEVTVVDREASRESPAAHEEAFA